MPEPKPDLDSKRESLSAESSEALELLKTSRIFESLTKIHSLGNGGRTVFHENLGFEVNLEDTPERRTEVDQALLSFAEREDVILAQLKTARGIDGLNTMLSKLERSLSGCMDSYYIDKVRESIGSIFEKIMPYFESCILDEAQNPNLAKSYGKMFQMMDFFYGLTAHIDDKLCERWNELVSDFFERVKYPVLEKLRLGLRGPNDTPRQYELIHVLVTIYNIGSTETKKEITKFAEEMVEDPAMSSPIFTLVGRIVEKNIDSSSDTKILDILDKEIVDFVKSFLEKHELPQYEDLLRSWALTYKESFATYMSSNLKMIQDIDLEHKGGARKLSDDFGIRNFTRYTKEMLMKQINEAEDANLSYGVIIFPIDDWNGAFVQWAILLDQLSRDLSRLGYGVRILETKGKPELARHLLRCSKKYTKKIEFGFVGGHGTKDSIQFGSREEDKLTKSDLLRKKVSGSGDKFFSDDATLILLSCSTGQNEGIGQELSRVFGRRKVIAPDTPTSLRSIRVYINEKGVLSFDIKYGTNDSQVFVSGQKTE